MRLFLAADHRGFSLKSKLVTDLPHVPSLADANVEVIDLGPSVYNQDDDFNDAAIAVANAVKEAEAAGDKDVFGILICGSAIGVSIQANHFKGIRAAVLTDVETAIAAREHDDANIICLSADRINRAEDPLENEKAYEDAFAVIEAFLTTPFSGAERYVRRIKRLDEEIE